MSKEDEKSRRPSPYNALGWALVRVLPSVSLIAGVSVVAWAAGENFGFAQFVYIFCMFVGMAAGYVVLAFTTKGWAKRINESRAILFGGEYQKKVGRKHTPSSSYGQDS